VALRRTFLPALGAVLLLAACGPPPAATPNHFTAKATRDCLEKAGAQISTDPEKVGFITLAAPAGGFYAQLPDNSLTIAYGNDEQEALQIARGFQEQMTTPQQRRRLRSLLERTGNAVVVWITEPTLKEIELIHSCLR
jgi:hypothetical protein